MKTVLALSILLGLQIASAKALNQKDPALSMKKGKVDCPFKKSGSAFAVRDIKPHGALAEHDARGVHGTQK